MTGKASESYKHNDRETDSDSESDNHSHRENIEGSESYCNNEKVRVKVII